MNAIEFQAKWLANKTNERASAQSHFNDLCALVNHPTPNTLDPDGEFFTFEKGVSKLRGSQGWADVWYRGHFAVEYKGRGKNLDAAYNQLAQYVENLENPPLLIVSDMDRIEVHTHFTNTVKKIHVIDLSTITEPESIRILTDAFFKPEALKPGTKPDEVTEIAAKQFGTIALGLRTRGHNPHETAHFLMQLLFCLFAEDIGILPNRIFSKVLNFGADYPARFNEQISALLSSMAIGGFFNMEPIPHINGGLFSRVQTFDLTQTEIGALAESARMDWSSIEPAIFGTLFERSLDPAKRAQLGAHYTGRPDIERVVEPVVMVPLRREWETVRAEMDALRTRIETAATTQIRRNRQTTLAATQSAFLKRLAEVRILDPACGSGNFLYIALERLLALEKEVIMHGAESGLSIGLPGVNPGQLLGMEIAPLARELAQVAIWIGYLQWTIANGFGWSEPVLQPLETVRLQDALITESTPRREDLTGPNAQPSVQSPAGVWSSVASRDHADPVSARHDAATVPTPETTSPPRHSERPGATTTSPPRHSERSEESPGEVGIAAGEHASSPTVGVDPVSTLASPITEPPPTYTETAWPTAEFIIGNPPFLGAKMMIGDMGGDYVESLRSIYDNRLPRFSDLCCYFFEKARAQIESGSAKRAGLLATNSIRGGANRVVLDRIKQTGDIFMAWSDEPWVLNGAAVRISIVGFDDGEELDRILNGNSTESINSDLSTATNLAAAKRLQENAGVCFLGVQLSGPFDFSWEQAQQMLDAPINPNGRPNSDVVKPMINASDIVRRPRDVWMVDFGVGVSEQEASLFELPFEHVKNHVQPMREKSRSQLRDNRWWLTLWPRPEMRRAIAELRRYLATPAVSKYRAFAWIETSVIANHAVVVFARDDDYFFGVLHSRAHERWSLRMGTWLGKGNDPRYTPTTCFETFPFPWPPGTEPADDPRVVAIAEAAAELDRLRRNWLDPENISAADLKKRTLTNLYNQRPTWLQHAHATLDRAVWTAYGWDDPDPAAVEEDAILARLLALNLERSGANTPS